LDSHADTTCVGKNFRVISPSRTVYAKYHHIIQTIMQSQTSL
jgi:hypothetical protein